MAGSISSKRLAAPSCAPLGCCPRGSGTPPHRGWLAADTVFRSAERVHHTVESEDCGPRSSRRAARAPTARPVPPTSAMRYRLLMGFACSTGAASETPASATRSLRRVLIVSPVTVPVPIVARGFLVITLPPADGPSGWSPRPRRAPAPTPGRCQPGRPGRRPVRRPDTPPSRERNSGPLQPSADPTRQPGPLGLCSPHEGLDCPPGGLGGIADGGEKEVRDGPQGGP